MATLTYQFDRKNDEVRVTITRSPTRQRPAWREEGSSSWGHNGVDKFLVRRFRGEFGKFRMHIQIRPDMTRSEVAAWVSPSHLQKSREFN